MSREHLKRILEEELKAFLKTGAGNFYRAESEKQEHEFFVVRSKIIEEIKKELGSIKIDGKSYGKKIIGAANRFKEEKKLEYDTNLEAIIQSTADSIIAETARKLKSQGTVDITDDGLTIIVTKPPATLGGFRYDKKLEKSVWVKDAEQTIFESIKNSYAQSRKTFKNRINSLLETINKRESLGYGKTDKTLVTGHMVGSSIIESRVSESISAIRQRLKGALSADEDVDKLIDKIFSDDIFTLVKKDTGPTTSFKLEIESAIFNDPALKHIEKFLKPKFEIAILQAISNPEQFATVEGSDSRLTIEKKKIIKKFKESLKKNKYVKSIKTIDTKINLSNSTTVTKKLKKKKPKLKKTKSTVKIPKSSSGVNLNQIKQPPSRSILNLNALKAQINARLSMTVIKNMGTPALENRTGRFARSVQVTDVVQTSKGFPSIGYSYQKFPYQTFEPGYKQGSAQRDPRTLIDRSIREIAQELIVGRFYTRRV